MFSVRRLGACVAASAFISLTPHASSDNSKNKASSLVFIGSGNSCGTPHLHCLLGHSQDKTHLGGCSVCRKSLDDAPPHLNKNYRGNPSLLVKYENSVDSTTYVQIDVGKTFRDNAVRWYPRLGIPHLDAVVITHGHADAFMGLDDLRMAQKRGTPIDIFLSWQTFETVKEAFPYLVRGQVPNFVGSAKSLKIVETLQRTFSLPKTYIANLNWNIMASPSLDEVPCEPFVAAGLEITPLPVFHGDNYLCLGFVLGKSNKKAVIITDVSAIPPKVLKCIKEWDIEILIIDTLHRTIKYPTHISLEQSLEIIEDLKPKKAYLIGVSHDIEHEETNKYLATMKKSKGLDIQVAYDGLEISLEEIDI